MAGACRCDNENGESFERHFREMYRRVFGMFRRRCLSEKRVETLERLKRRCLGIVKSVDSYLESAKRAVDDVDAADANVCSMDYGNLEPVLRSVDRIDFEWGRLRDLFAAIDCGHFAKERHRLTEHVLDDLYFNLGLLENDTTAIPHPMIEAAHESLGIPVSGEYDQDTNDRVVAEARRTWTASMEGMRTSIAQYAALIKSTVIADGDFADCEKPPLEEGEDRLGAMERVWRKICDWMRDYGRLLKSGSPIED